MRIIYHCWGGAHSSVTAAAIHLGWLPQDCRPTPAELMQIPHYDKQTREDHGHLRYMGEDEGGNQVYIMGRRGYSPIASRCLPGVLEAIGVPRQDLVMVDTMPYVNVVMMIGGTLSRAMGLVKMGRPIVLFGTRLAYDRLRRLVARVKSRTNRPVPEWKAPQAGPTKVVYSCYGSAHSSVVCAALHLGRLPRDRRPRPAEIADLPHFDRITWAELGDLHLIGLDEGDRAIYTVGMGGGYELMRLAIYDLLDAYRVPHDHLVLVNALPGTNLWTLLGGYLSRRLGLVCLGRPLTLVGVTRCYKRFISLVAQTRQRLAELDAAKAMGDNEKSIVPTGGAGIGYHRRGGREGSRR